MGCPSRCPFTCVSFVSLPVKEFIAAEHRVGFAEESYVWLVGWCSPVEKPPLSAVGNADPCDFDGGFGYVQQFQQDTCITDFNEFVDMTAITGGVQITTRSRYARTGLWLKQGVFLWWTTCFFVSFWFQNLSPSVTLQPPSVTLQPPSVTLQPPSVTLNRRRLASRLRRLPSNRRRVPFKCRPIVCLNNGLATGRPEFFCF